jgi:N-acetylglucosaminyldiphosphoundecaprenol N-acetyl-beta-D-mannosaminyltransferase
MAMAPVSREAAGMLEELERDGDDIAALIVVRAALGAPRPVKEESLAPAPEASAAAARVAVGAAWFDDVDMAGAVARVVEMARRGDRPRHVCTGNLDHLAVLERDAAFREAYRTADLVIADGMPVLWLSRLAAVRRRSAGAVPLRERVAGSDLFWELGRASAEHGLRLFLLGGLPGAAARAADALCERYPGATVAGTYCPPHETFATPEEQAEIAARIRAAAPDVLLVGLGAPKQEKWICEHKAALGVPVCIGVGGSFEMAAGMARRAPQWMRRSGLEWSYRLMQDPARLWRRYICRDLPHLVRLAAGIVAGRSGGAA